MNRDEDKENDDIKIDEPTSRDREDDIELPSEDELIDFKKSREVKRDNTDHENNIIKKNNIAKVNKQLSNLSKKLDVANRLLSTLIAAMILLLLVMFILSMQIKDIRHKIDHNNLILNDINKSFIDINRANSQKALPSNFKFVKNWLKPLNSTAISK